MLKEVGGTGIEIRFTRQRKWLSVKEKEMTEEERVGLLMYADDMAVLGEDSESLRRFMIELDKQLISVGMMMNVKKTKMMVMDGKVEEPLVIRGEKVDLEESFPYLGVTIRADESRAEGRWQLASPTQ